MAAPITAWETDSWGAGDPLAESPERAELRRSVRRVIAACSPPERVRALDEARTFDHELYAALASLGVLGIDAPAALEGVGDVRDQLVVIEELGAGPTSMAAFMIAQYAVVQILAKFAITDAHREVLASAVAGRTKVSFALSEPDGGTDVARAMKTRAEVVDGGYRLNGQKLWTSAATLAEWIIVLARTAAPERSPIEGISMFLVSAKSPGIEIRALNTFGINGMSSCEIFFDGVVVPADDVLGELHKGMRQVFATVNREGLNAAAATLGVGRGALALAVDYARSRKVFGRAVGGFQVPQHWLVNGAVALESARSLMRRASEIEVAGGDASTLASMAKLVASEAAVDIALKGMQLMGGAGYLRDHAMQRFFRDGRLWSFSPLNNEMVRSHLGERYLGLPRSF
jgi:alkylation response protein AidB-like acyl-CoA dehydrogenase